MLNIHLYNFTNTTQSQINFLFVVAADRARQQKLLTQRAKYAAQRGRFVQKRVLPLPRSPPRDSLKVTVRNVTVIGSLENKVADSPNQPHRQFHRHNCVISSVLLLFQ